MNDFIFNSWVCGVVVSIAGYEIGLLLKRKCKWPIFNPLLLAILFVMLFLTVFHIDYESYYVGAKYLGDLLTPATICLAIPLYRQFELLKQDWKAVLAGVSAGVLASLGSVYALSLLFGLSHEQYVTLLPKSITTAIGMGVSEELGGVVTISVAIIIVTGILGSLLAEPICRLFRIQDPVARGLAIGTSSHAIGTVKAMELGEAEGAMSSLAIVVSGVSTVIGASFFANLL